MILDKLKCLFVFFFIIFLVLNPNFLTLIFFKLEFCKFFFKLLFLFINFNVLNSKNSNNSNSFKKKLYQKINFEEKHTKSPIKNPKVPIKMTKMFINNQIYHFKNRNLINKTVLKKNNKKNEPLPSIISNTSLKNQSIDHYHEKINLKYTINSNYKTINVTPFKLFDNNKTLKKNFKSSRLDNINVSKLGFNTRNVVKKKNKKTF